MNDFVGNIEKTRNTNQQIEYYNRLNDFIEDPAVSMIDKMTSFPLYTPRQIITSFVEKYEVYKLCKNIPGSIIECGVAGGKGLMTFAHLCSIFEPYHYVRKIIGFDTFEGFPEISDKDKTSKAEHMKKGGLSSDSYQALKRAVELYDMNRALGHLKKVELVKGDISETFPKYLEENPSLVIALLYLDLDLYKPTLDTLKLVVNRIPKGGVIAFDELNHSDYPGETIAVMETVGVNNLRLKRLDISSMLAYAILE